MSKDGRDNGINLVFKKSLKETSIESFEIIFSDDDEDYNHLSHFYARIIEFKYFSTYKHKADAHGGYVCVSERAAYWWMDVE